MIKISVIQDDIDKGVRSSVIYCPVARAASRILNLTCKVGRLQIYMRPRTRKLPSEYWLPSEIQEWIKKFDLGEKVEPISFEIGYSDA